ncbi:unnamed protein product [Rotaria socialis]|uniref:Uncharacterized protein n=1 Tax=Rotaria socialis TaxID=392032 RepID=A0A818LNL5_9BILA|nr:unnamed protein product [Rotaria socialis]CAF3576001.1 unnamed protein product [Rotaria socialis]CAF4199641.1 unnamed protein product [Rotaria socialis]CAF4583331.1 unnamed protein product [Rotaria socialis]
MEQEVLILATKHVHQAISNALNDLTQISSSLLTNYSSNRNLNSNISLRCRSSSNNRNNRKVSLHNAIPRCSLPATENDLVHYQTHLLSYQQTNSARCRPSRTTNSTRSSNVFDVQYSFSLNKPCVNKNNKQQYKLADIQNFANKVIKDSIQTALLQMDHENLTDEDETSDLLLHHSPSYTPTECCQTIHSYVDRFIHLTIDQTIEKVASHDTELFSNHLANEILIDVLSTIENDEKHCRTTKSDSIQSEINEHQQTGLFDRNRYDLSATTSSTSNEESVESLMNHISQQIYLDSFQELRQIFTKTNNYG